MPLQNLWETYYLGFLIGLRVSLTVDFGCFVAVFLVTYRPVMALR
jgi:hypothetical protein